MKDKKVYLMQVGLMSLGFDPKGLDGDHGPKTEAAFKEWEASLKKNDLKLTSDIAQNIVKIAKTQVGIRESSKNRGDGIEKYWDATTYPTGYKNREPYCAAFVCWVVREATKDIKTSFSALKSPVAYDAEKWGAANAKKGVKVLTKRSAPKPGDIFTLATASHVGLVIANNGSTITTIEGNTDGSGSREGDGVYQRTRNISTIRKLIRIT